MSKLKKYKAIKPGFAGKFIEQGEVFEYDFKGKEGKWFKEYKESEKSKSQSSDDSKDKEKNKGKVNKDVI